MKTMRSLMVSFGILCASAQNVRASDTLGESSAPASRESPEAVTRADGRSQPKGTMEEVIVTAQKRGDERLQEIPVPISVLSATSLLENGATGMQDYFSEVPGVSLTSALGGTSTVIIRGVATNGLNDNPTVGVTVDDAPYGASTFFGGGLQPIDLDPNDLRQIEVLRGPQGTLYGASSIGGLLRYVMTEPSLDKLSGRVMVNAQSPRNNDGLDYAVRGSVNLPIKSSFALRLSGFDRSEAGYIDDTFSGKKGINGGHSYGGRAALLWRADENWSVKLSAVRQLSHRDASGIVDYDPLGDERLESSDYVPGSAGADRSVTFLTGLIEGSLGGINLTSISAYTRSNSIQREGFTRGLFLFVTQLAEPSADAGLYSNNQHASKFSQELRATIPLGDKIDWLVGAFYTKEEGDYFEPISSGVRATGERINGIGDVLGGPDGSASTTYTEIAAFTNLTVRFTDRFDVQFGGRLSENRQSLTEMYGPSFLSGGLPVSRGPIRATDQPFTYLITPRFKLTEDWMVYSRITSGYRPGGPTFNSNLPGAPDSLKADTTENYELGIKGDMFDHMLSMNASAYYIDWTDIPVGVQPDPNTVLGYNINAGGAISKGLELSFTLRLLQGLSFSAWGAWSEAYIDELPSDSSAPFVVGDRLPFSPRFSGNVSIDYERPIFETMSASVGTALRYVGDRCAAVGKCEDLMPAYTQIDAYAGFKSGGWTVNAFINNLTDERGIIGPKPLEIFGTPDSGVLIILPRTVGLSVSKDF